MGLVQCVNPWKLGWLIKNKVTTRVYLVDGHKDSTINQSLVEQIAGTLLLAVKAVEVLPLVTP